MRAIIAVLALCLIGCSRYDYSERGADGVRQPVRVDRLSGKTEVLAGNKGWVELKPAARPTPIPSSVPCSEEDVRRANEPESSMDKYLPERLKARPQCRTIPAESR